jgi:nicotinate-nucleotide pyrophosphorylase (carboxylating)
MIFYKQIEEIPKEYIEQKINEFLAEDAPDGDATTESTIDKATSAVAQIKAKDNLVLAGRNVVEAMFQNADLDFNFSDGDWVEKNAIIGQISGNAIEILRKERIFLNLMQRMSGIATVTKKYADIAKPYNVAILDTRKTTPGLRMFEKYSVRKGGGQNHRYSLSTGILIKDNHIAAANGVLQAVLNCKKTNKNLPVQVEIADKSQIKDAISAGVDGLLLDNMAPDYLQECVIFAKDLDSNIFLEASGGITLDNLHEYVKTGVNAISVGALTHSVKSSDISLKIL